MREGNWTIGIDLGQVYDYSAMCIVERVVEIKEQPFIRAVTRDHCYVRFIKRWELGTHYRQIVAEVGDFVKRGELEQSVIVIDGTGVGREVVQLFNQAFRNGKLGKYWPIGYVITGGRDVTNQLVPKRELVGVMQTLIQDKRLNIADNQKESPTLKKELENFRIKKKAETGEETYESAREGDHDDLVLACALACWYRHTMTQPRALVDVEREEVQEVHTNGERRSQGIAV